MGVLEGSGSEVEGFGQFESRTSRERDLLPLLL